MSYESEFWELQRTTSKKKKKKEEETNVKVSNKPYAQQLEIAPHKVVENNVNSGFIAPILSAKPTVTSRNTDDDKAWYEKFFQKPELFDDGYQAGDIAKTILGTTADFSLNVVSGAGNFIEGITDTIGYGIADVSDALGADDFANSTRERVKKSIVQNVLGGITEKADRWSVLGDTSDAVAQGLGMIGTLAAGGYVLGGAGLGTGAVSAITSGLTGLSGFGSGMSEAYQGGATDSEARVYGVITGASEALSELMFGGLGKVSKAVGFSRGLSSFDDVLAKKVSNLFSNQIVKNLAEYGIKSGAEGFEEVVAGIAQGIGKKITYMSEEELGKILKDESLLEQFVVGSVTSSFAQASGLHNANKAGTDFVSGLNENEQKVVDRVVEDLIAERKANGEKVTNKTKNKIYDDVIKDLDKGYIDTDTIESVLGGEEYETYKRVSDRGSEYEAKLKELIEHYQAEYDSFSDIPRGEMTRNQIDREAEVKAKLEELNTELEDYKKDKTASNLKSKLGQNVLDLVKDSRLAESYYETERSKQKFEADTSKYKNENARQTVQNAVDSGLFRNTNADHDAVDFMSKVASDIGLVFEYTTNEKPKNDYIELQTKKIAELEKIPEAYRDNEKLAEMKDALEKVQSGKRKVDGSTTEGVITINLDSDNPVEFIIGHEVLHNLAKSKAYKNGDLHKAFKSYLGDKEYARMLEKVEDTYKGTESTPEEELIANLVGKYVFNEYDFVKHLATNNQDLFHRAWDSIKHLYRMATAGSKEARQLERVKYQFEKAYKEVAKSGAKVEGTKHDIVALENGNVYVKASRKVINGTTVDEMRKDISHFFNSLLKDNSSLDIPTIDGAVLTITKTETADKARDNYKSVNGKPVKMTDEEFTVKMHIESHIDEVAEVSKPKSKGKKNDEKNHAFAKDGFTYRKAYFEDFDGQYYEVTLSIGHNGTVATVYNVGKIEKSALPSAKILAVVGSKPLGKTLSKNSISEKPEKSSENGKLSLSDEIESNYNEAVKNKDLETAQKIVDEVAKENGYTIKAYHGGDKFFTVFGKGNKTSQAPEGSHFFSSNKDVAYSYTTYKRDVNTDVNSYPVYEQLTRAGTFEKNRVARGGVYSSFLKLENPYIVDFEGEYYSRKIDGRDINEIAAFARDNGYDGVIAKNIKDPGDMGDANWESKPSLAVADDYIVFNPNQIKSAEPITYDDNGNVVPLSERFKAENNDIRFSLSENVEETKELMALHNLHSNELMKQLKMGGIAYPSVAVTKPGTLSHEGFGDITLILNKDAIDPKKSKYNKLYSADAYTPTFPNVDYEASSDVANNIADKVKSLYDAIPEDYKRSLTAFRDYTNINERLNSARGEEGLIERYLDDYSFKQLYLADKGDVVPTEIKRTETQISEVLKENYQFVVDKLGAELIESSKPMDSYTPPLTARVQWYEQHGEALKEAFAEYWADGGTMTKEEALEIANSESARYWVREIKAIADYIKTGGITIKEEADIPSTNALIDEKINAAEYKEWLANLFSGIEGSSGIRNSKDLFTPSGKRRSFSQLHDPVTIDNVIKVMRKQGQTGQGAFGTGNIQGASTQEFGSIAEMKANSDRLGVMDEAEHKEITQQINDRIFEIAERYSNGKDLMDAQTTIVEAVSKYETKEGIARYLKQFDYVYKYTDSIGDDIIELRDYIRSIPTPYFEAKPQRAVSFDEVAAFVIPRDADIKVKQELLNKGYSIAEYDPKIEGDRQRVVNSFEEYKFSLSDTTETSKGYATFYGRKIANRNIPLADIAPIQETAESSVSRPAQSVAPTPTQEAAPTSVAEPLEETPTESNDAEEKPTRRSELHQKIVEGIKTKFAEKGFDFDEVLNKAKNLSTFATVDNIPQRVMEKALGYKQGQTLADETVNKVAQNESEGIKWLNSFTDRKNGVLAQISKQYNIKPGSKESAAAQMYAEGFYVDKNNEIVEYGDRELAIDFPNARVRENIKGLAKDERIRQIYDETLEAINESRRRNLYPEIQRLDNYFLHFRAMEDTFSRLGLPFNPNDIRAKDLPTDLNGVTADLKPGQPYFASAMHRTGMRTSFDLLGGLEKYLTSAKNQIYHIDDIQTLRALRNYIADTYGQAKGLESLDELTEEEAQERIEQVYDSHLSTFAKFLNEEANVLAGKTALIDRGLEGIIGRRGITLLNTINGQVGSNMVGGNVSSSLTNFLVVVQGIAKSNKYDFVKSLAQTSADRINSLYGKSDGFKENSPTIIRRKGAERFNRTFWQKMGDTGYVLMSAVDDVATEILARTKYNELTRKGMDSQQAHFETDKWVSRLMGDRSLGQMPQLYNSKMLGLVTKFQLEVRNQLDSQFYDTIQEAKVSNEEIENKLLRNAKTAAKVGSTFFQLAVLQHLFGKAFESVAGYNPAFDIIEVLIKTLGFDDDEEDEDTVLDNIEEGFFALLEDLPYTSTFTGGRIPISSALPIKEFLKGEDQYGNEKSRWDTIKETAPYYLLPTGYGQVKKTAQGLGMFSDKHPVAGSYTDSGNLRFPVEDTLWNRVQAGVFGQYANKNARTYFDEGYAPLKEKQIQEYIDVDMPIEDYWQYREDIKDLDTLEEKFDFVAGMDLPVEKKNILINNIVDRKEKVDLENYDDFENYEEFDFYAKNTEKYNFLQDNGVTYKEYKADEDTKEKYDSVYSWWKNYPEKVTVSKAVTDNVIEYRGYTSDLDDIRADKDADGKSISGSAKEKKKAYIWGLDIDEGAKYILFKNEYKADDTYNNEIIDYLNSRDDISYDEMNTICEELGFKVNRETGYISWD